MNEIVIARIRFLITMLLFAFFLYLGTIFSSFGLKMYFFLLFFYNLSLYYLFKKRFMKESFLISLFDEIFIFSLFILIKGIENKFLFLSFFPVIKEIIYNRHLSAYILSILSWVAILCFSLFITPFISLEISFSLLPFSFLIPYIGIYYTKEKGG